MVLDYIPHTLAAVTQFPGVAQTKLTELVWGTSGRGNPRLINLFNYMVRDGLLTRTQRGRSITYTTTQKGDELLAQKPVDYKFEW